MITAKTSNSMPVIEALAMGFIDGGVKIMVNYPGFHSNELHGALDGGCTSINEQSAYAFVWGASLAGARSLVTMKNVGLNSAADAFLSAQSLGCNAGMVLVVFDDCNIQHSQNRADSRHFYRFYGGLWFEPTSTMHAYEIARVSFGVSEDLGTPVVIRITNILYNRGGHFNIAEVPPVSPDVPELQFARDPQRWVAHPSNALYQEAAMFKRQHTIAEFVETLAGNGEFNGSPRIDAPVLIHGAGVLVNPEGAISTYTLPLPNSKLRRSLASTRGDITVREHGSNVVLEMVESLFRDRIVVPQTFNNIGERGYKYHCFANHETLFAAIRSLPDVVVVGDLGEYTMDAPRTIDACLCYGASVAVGAGFSAASRGSKRVVVVTGDGAFLHSGKLALEEAVERRIGMTVIVFDNGGTRGPGGQKIPGSLLVNGVQRTRTFDYADLTVADWENILSNAPETMPELIIVKTAF